MVISESDDKEKNVFFFGIEMELIKDKASVRFVPRQREQGSSLTMGSGVL